MQTSSKVTSAKKVGILASLFHNLFNSEKAISGEPVGSTGGKGHYFESIGAIEHSFHCRSSQSKRRKLERKTGRR